MNKIKNISRVFMVLGTLSFLALTFESCSGGGRKMAQSKKCARVSSHSKSVKRMAPTMAR